jgi:hypothetical protein|tara:strand:+ start:177 stop:1010 length:834 start_codon:yes stop_codon:yes gene_type:complete
MTDIANIQSLAIAADTVTNVELYQPYADNATVGTTFETISNTNADQVFPVLAGADIDVVSGSAADDVGSTGATSVRVTYLDANSNQATEDVAMNGTGAVEMTEQTISFIQKAEIVDSGTGLAAAGAITIADVTGGGVHALIDAGSKESGNCTWKVPAGHTGYVHGFWYDVDAVAAGAGTAEIALQVAHAESSGVANSETWRTVAKVTVVEGDNDIVAATGGNQNNMGSFSFPGNIPFKVPAKSIVRLAAKAPAAVAVTAGFSMSVQGSGSGTTITDS